MHDVLSTFEPGELAVTETPAGPDAGRPASRRDAILDAAEFCFVRHGFHRSTMQDIAREAAMSPANIYRHFASKEDVVVSLAGREAARAARLLAGLETGGDGRAELAAIIDAYFVRIPREQAVLRLDIWSEVTRNPGFSALAREQEAQFRTWFTGTLAALATSERCDPDALFSIVGTLLKGMLVDRALLPDHDGEAAARRLHALIEAGLAGDLAGARRPLPGAAS